MKAAISLLVLLLSMCGVQTENHGADASTQDVSTELKELRDVVEESMGWRATLERALQDTKAEMKTEVDNLKRENAAQEAELTAVKTRLAATETEVENQLRAAPKVAFSAGLRESGAGFTESGSNDLSLVFKRVITDVGEAYSSTTGVFTAPVRGVYYFRFSVVDRDSRYMFILMYKNGEKLIMQLYEYNTDGNDSFLSGGLTLQLEKGDAVNMVLPAGSRLYDDSDYNYSTFSGFLLFPL